jgi:c-di-GMP-binding flagellar brake protein YcgR
MSLFTLFKHAKPDVYLQKILTGKYPLQCRALRSREPAGLSFLVFIDRADQILHIDKISTVHWDIGQSFSVVAEIHNLALSFQTTIIDIDEENEIYICRYPELIHRQKRRKFFRVRIPMTDDATVCLYKTASPRRFHGRIVNFSEGGFALEILRSDFDSYFGGLEKIYINTPFEFEALKIKKHLVGFDGTAILANVRRQNQIVLLGFKFAQLTDKQSTLLARLALDAQRSK